MSVQNVPVANRPEAFERVNPRSAVGDANPKFHSPVLGGWLPRVAEQAHFGTLDAACERRPTHHRNSLFSPSLGAQCG
jgi:hypothetical protein